MIPNAVAADRLRHPRLARGFLIAAAVVAVATQAACSAPEPPKASRMEMVPMSDGTRLATDVYLPDEGGPAWPTLLIRTPYGRRSYNREYGRETRRGYAIVIQDMRGRFDSEGKALAFLHCGWYDNRDGVETVKWVLNQPWCNGKVGTMGASAMGITQYMLAAADPPPIAAQYVLVAAPSLYHEGGYVSGALRACLTIGWLTDCGFHPDNIWLTAMHPFYDEHWKAVDSLARVERVNIPAVHFAGWFDVFLQGNIDAFVARHNQGGPGARGKQKLIVGPWGHGQSHGKKVGELTFPLNTRDWKCDSQQWFDHYLKGVDTGVEKVPAVQYYTMGAVDEPGAPGNYWQTADNWPPPSMPVPFFLNADGTLSRSQPADEHGKVSYDYDPLRPVPTRGGCEMILPCGPFDQRDIEQRSDVVTFTTEPLTEPTEVTGRLTARLTIASDCVDTDFTVKLTDVHPDGRSMNVADGLARCRCRGGYDRLTLLEPGKPAEIEVDLWSTSIVFNKGHRIRLAVSSSNYPRFDVNVNTGWPGWPLCPVLTAHNTVFCNSTQASHIVLPIVGQ